MHRFKGGLTESQDQDTQGGIMMCAWTRETVPGSHELEAIRIKQKETGTWIDRARKNIRIKFEAGQKEIVRQPRVVLDQRTYAGVEYRGGPPTGKVGPKWSELYVGEIVVMTAEALIRKETYGLRDRSGALEHRHKGFVMEKSIEMSKGETRLFSSRAVRCLLR